MFLFVNHTKKPTIFIIFKIVGSFSGRNVKIAYNQWLLMLTNIFIFRSQQLPVRF